MIDADEIQWRKAREVDHSGPHLDFNQVALLPESERERMCRALLAEFGVTRITRVTDKGEMIHCCPLPNHRETNPSASLNYKKLTFNCKGCGSTGGLLWFIATCRGESHAETVRWIQDQTGIGPDAQPLPSLLDYLDAVYNNKAAPPPPIPKMAESILEPWLAIHPYLTDPISEGGRGIPEANLISHRVGFGSFRINIGSEYDPHWVSSQRIVIPHFWKDNLVGWQTRRLLKDGTPKYQSSGDFPKDRTIYDYDERASVAVVVESPMSVLSKCHLPVHIESTFGASVTERQMRQVSVHRRVVLFMDNDEAGWDATEKMRDYLAAYSEVFAVESPYAADPADMDDGTYMRLVESAIPASLWKRPSTLEKWEWPSRSTAPLSV